MSPAARPRPAGGRVAGVAFVADDSDKQQGTPDAGYGPCILDSVVDMVETCVHAGSGIASVRTKELDLPATAANLEWLGAKLKEKLNMIYLPIGRHCKVMIFPHAVKLRCLDDDRTLGERQMAVDEVMNNVSEALVCAMD
jgi:hypothetical protein